MRHYEIVLLIHPDQSEQVPAMLKRYQDMVTAEKGLVHRVEDWGRRRLAYMINEIHKAHYVMLNIECGIETLRELEKTLKFNDSIIRNLVIRRARAITEQSALATAKAEEDREEARIDAEKKAARATTEAANAAAQKARASESKIKDEDKDEDKNESKGADKDESKDADKDENQNADNDDDPAQTAEQEKPEPQPETA